MCFLRDPSGAVEPRLFYRTDDPVGEARSEELAAAVADSGADAVVLVSEAWRAPQGSAADHGRVRDTVGVQEVLLVVGLDRSGDQVVFETPVARGADGSARLLETVRHGADYVVHTLNGVRSVWGLPRRIAFRAGAFSVEIPAGWTATEDDKVVELEPASRRAAAHFSVFERREPRPPADGEAVGFVQRLAPTCGFDASGAREYRTSDGLAAHATLEAPVDDATPLVLGARVSSARAVIYTYNGDPADHELRDQALAIFASVRVAQH